MLDTNTSPLPNNPALVAYENFAQKTPFVTRTLLIVQAISYVISWFFDPHYALGNIPHFTIFRLEIYRILLSPLVNSSLFSLILAFWSFQDHGTRLEHGLGSTSFAWLCLMLGILTLIFIGVSIMLYFVSGKVSFLFQDSSGIWIILFGTLSMECVRAPRASTRRFFVTDVPVRYYPLLLYLLFVLLGQGVLLGQMISMGLGYALGFESKGEDTYTSGLQLNRYLLLDSITARTWEDRYLNSLTNHPGWIHCHAASGSGAWDDNDACGMSLPLFGTAEDNENTTTQSSSTSNLPLGSGRTLGGANKRGVASASEARQARLEALEKRAQGIQE